MTYPGLLVLFIIRNEGSYIHTGPSHLTQGMRRKGENICNREF